MMSHAEGGGPPYKVIDGTAWRRTSGSFAAPAGYPNINPTWLTQWLDDDTFIIVVNRRGDDDLLECHLSTRACRESARPLGLRL